MKSTVISRLLTRGALVDYKRAVLWTKPPVATFNYRLSNSSALKWAIDQYRIKTDKRSGIGNDPEPRPTTGSSSCISPVQGRMPDSFLQTSVRDCEGTFRRQVATRLDRSYNLSIRLKDKSVDATFDENAATKCGDGASRSGAVERKAAVAMTHT